MIAPARRAAYDALRAAATRSRDLGDLLAESRQRLNDDRDRALAAAIVVGTLRWRNQLDWLLARAANRDVASPRPLLDFFIRRNPSAPQQIERYRTSPRPRIRRTIDANLIPHRTESF